MKTKLNSVRSSCKDVWNAFLVSCASYAGIFEFPVIQPTYQIPNRLIAFFKAISSKDFNQWVHFFEDDYLFERLWRNPNRYLELLSHFNGVILPDFSVYRDMPLIMQLWNIYRSRAIGIWLQNNGVTVIVNIRFGDRRTVRYCCDGVPKNCTIALGSHGTLQNREDRKYFSDGLKNVVKILQPKVIVIYGNAPAEIFDEYRHMGISIIPFESDISISHKEVV